MAQQDGLAAGAQTVRLREGQRLRRAAAKADDLRQDILPAAGGQGDAVAHRGRPGQAGDLDREAADTDEGAFHARRDEIAQGRTAGLDFFRESRFIH